VNLELRAMTNSQRIWDSAVMISSTMPSEKYSWSGAPLKFANGISAIEGLSGSGGCGGKEAFGQLRRSQASQVRQSITGLGQ